jgi:hypothetical protein
LTSWIFSKICTKNVQIQCMVTTDNSSKVDLRLLAITTGTFESQLEINF